MVCPAKVYRCHALERRAGSRNSTLTQSTRFGYRLLQSGDSLIASSLGELACRLLETDASCTEARSHGWH